MSLEDSIAKLGAVAKDAATLFNELKDLGDADTTASQRSKIKKLVARLDTGSREASRERRKEEIAILGEVIAAHESSLTVPGIPSDVRALIKADLRTSRARRTRLINQGTDFGGIVTDEQAAEIVDLVNTALDEVQRKRSASAFVGTLFKVGDLALSLAGKLALPG